MDKLGTVKDYLELAKPYQTQPEMIGICVDWCWGSPSPLWSIWGRVTLKKICQTSHTYFGHPQPHASLQDHDEGEQQAAKNALEQQDCDPESDWSPVSPNVL